MSHRESLKIHSIEGGVDLDVWFYKPVAGSGPFPVVVAGHGLTLTKEAGLAAFGEHWAEHAGYSSLIFDYRGFGNSDGQPRNLVTLERQIQDYKSVLAYARSLPETFRADRIVVMGSALSGLHVAELICQDGALAGGMAHCPMLDGYSTLISADPNPRVLLWACIDYIFGKLGLSPILIPAVGSPNQFSFFNSPSSRKGFVDMYANSQISFDDMPNLVSPRLAFDVLSARPGLKLKDAHNPMLVVMAENDDLVPPAVTRAVLAQANGKVEFAVSPGGHFDVMPGGLGFQVNIEAQIKFLRRLL